VQLVRPSESREDEAGTLRDTCPNAHVSSDFDLLWMVNWKE
jgi:hypothetical protein